jgi:2-aminoadipate transaminase
MLEEKVKDLVGAGNKPKFIYVVPTFQNPAGVTMSAEKRKRLLEIASKYDVLIVEDSPYSYLRYEGDPMPHLIDLDDENRVVRLETFSKILSPGFRIAWCTGPSKLIDKMVIAKQATDLCTNPFGQYVAYKYVSQGILDEHLEYIKELYNKKRLTMLEAMDEHFPEEASWNRPEGGMFVWVTLPEGVNTRDMFEKAIDNNVAYVVGDAFFVEDKGYNTMRLNFTHSSEENIKKGIKKLGEVIKKELKSMGKKEMIDTERVISP